MQTKVLSSFETEGKQIFIALKFFDKGLTNVGIFWQKSQHEYLAIPHFIPVVITFASEDEDEIVRYLLKRITDKSLKILIDEISLDVMASIASKWMRELEES